MVCIAYALILCFDSIKVSACPRSKKCARKKRCVKPYVWRVRESNPRPSVCETDVHHCTNSPVEPTEYYNIVCNYHVRVLFLIHYNVIVENILSQVNEEGHMQLILYEIVDHRTTYDAIPKGRGYITTPSGAQRKKRTMRGWKICV